jgi:hypothetical protein
MFFQRLNIFLANLPRNNHFCKIKMMYKIIFLLIFSFLLIFIYSQDVFAWGPGAHLGITSAIELAKIGSTVAKICEKFYPQFLWGSIMADIIIGKNFSNWKQHPHNWEFIFSLFFKASEDYKKSFMIGYMTHLAQDIVAHNFMIPEFAVASAFFNNIPKNLSILHFKVERKADDLVNPQIWEQIRYFQSLPENRKCVEFLEENLNGTIFGSPKTNSRIYLKILSVNTIKEIIKTKFKLIRNGKDQKGENIYSKAIGEYFSMAKKTSEDFLKNFERSKMILIDPTGTETIYFANSLKNSVLKIKKKKGEFDEEKFLRLLSEVQPPIFGKRTPVLFTLKTSS